MKHRLLPCLLAAALGGWMGASSSASAQTPAAWSPEPALLASPAWRAALAGRQEQGALAAQTRAGNGEWTVSLAAAQRREPLLQHGSNQDLELSLQRPWRLPGKAAAADLAGAAREDYGRARLALAWREQAERLLAQWAAWRRETEGQALLQAQRDSVAQEVAALARRQQLGDAAPAELLQAKAALAGAESRLAQGRSAADEQQRRLQTLLGDAPLPPTTWQAPVAHDINTAQLEEQDTALQLAEAEARLSRRLAELERREQRPDPVLAVRALRGRSGEERVLGVSLSLPIGGEGRSQAGRAAAARAAAAEAMLDQTRLDAQLRARQLLRQLELAQQQLSLQARHAEALQQHADKLARAYALGEAQLGDRWAARRQAQEAALALAQARIERQLLEGRIALASSRLWPLSGHPVTRSAP